MDSGGSINLCGDVLIDKYINKVIQGDCLEVMKELPAKCVDLVVTDPPYNMNYTGRGNINAFSGFDNDNLDADKHSLWFTNILNELYRILKDNTAIYVYIDFRNYARIYNLIAQYFNIKNCIVWHKNNFGMGQHYRFQHEFCIYAIKGKHKLSLEKRNISDVWQFSKEDVNSYKHPTQKPVSAMYKPIKYSSNIDSVVIDPFLGSGTTGVAATRLNRRFIGIEKEPKYCEIAQQRIEKERNQLKLF